jgi:hypothetical protein
VATARVNAEYGPSWRDVGECLARLQAKWGGVWSIRIVASPRRGEPGRVSVVCSRLSAPDRRNPRGEDYDARVYPNGDSANMCVCMYGLLLSLDGKLDAAKVVAERQMTF